MEIAAASGFAGGFALGSRLIHGVGGTLEDVRILMESVAYLEDPAEYAKAYARLPRFRQEKADSLLFEHDRRLSVGAWLLLERAFMLEGLDLGVYAIGHSGWGKPHAVGSPLRFSISHSGEYAMCAVSRAGEVGCDIQRIDAYDGGLARACMMSCEVSAIEASSCCGERALRFCRHWVAKESYIKALGCGLAKAPASFAVGLRDIGESDSGCNPKNRGAIGEALVFDGGQADRANIFEARAPEGYCAAVCALVRGPLFQVDAQAASAAAGKDLECF